MAMATCPECGTRISDKAKRCPYCGCVSEDALMPLSAMPPATQPTKVIIPQASVFDNGINLLKPEDNAKIVEFLTDAERMAQFAPVIYEAIMKTIGRSENKYAADFSKKAEELMKKGELVFSVERKSGELLPQLRRVDNGQVYEKARIHTEDVPKDMLPTVYAVQNQANINEMMRKIEAVSEEVSALRLEGQADRIAKANSVWAQLQQAALMQGARLRELKMLSIAADATEARCLLEENFKVQVKLLKGKGSSKAKGLAGNNAMTALTAIAMMSRTEYAAYSLLGEDDAARLSLEQFKGFVLSNKLDNKQILLQINSFSNEDRGQIVNGFHVIAKSVKTMEFEPPEEPKELLSGEEENEGASDE